jgi:hypothetical protein
MMVGINKFEYLKNVVPKEKSTALTDRNTGDK